MGSPANCWNGRRRLCWNGKRTSVVLAYSCSPMICARFCDLGRNRRRLQAHDRPGSDAGAGRFRHRETRWRCLDRRSAKLERGIFVWWLGRGAGDTCNNANGPGRSAHPLAARVLPETDTSESTVSYRISPLRDGRSFAARNLEAFQEEARVLAMACSFTTDSDGYEYDLPNRLRRSRTR